MKRIVVSSTELKRQQLLQELYQFAHRRVKGFSKFERPEDNIYFEHHSIESMIRNYIKWYNENVREHGNGYATDWDPDDRMVILYKNGETREISPEWDEGNKLIPLDGIDSIILDGSWGTAFAGPSVVFRDETTYDDIIDIRADFA